MRSAIWSWLFWQKSFSIEELRSESLDLPSLLFLENEYPMEWQMQIVQCLQGMSRERLQAIRKFMDEMDYEPLKFY